MKKRDKIASFLLSYTLLVMTSYASPVVSLPSPGLNLLSRAAMIKPVASETSISFMVWLKLRNKKALDQLVQDVYDVHSSRYHQFLTYATYEKEFAPSSEAEKAVQKFFISHGMQTQVINHGIRVMGTAAQIKQALQVQMNYYKYQNETVYANSTAPTLTPEIAQYVSEISGLSTIPEFRSNLESVNSNKNKTYHNLNFIWRNFAPYAIPTDISLQGFSGANLQKTYGLANIPTINGVHLDGAGQTLIVVDKCGSNGPAAILSDANQYFNGNGITPFNTAGPGKNFAVINPDGTPFITCPGGSSFSREIVLDVEASHTIAPADNTVLVLGTDQKTTLIATISNLTQNNYTIAGFPNAYVISNSWSGPESSLDSALESALQVAAASGISVDFSSGDCGDNTYPTSTKCTGTWPGPLQVNYPSSSAYVTAVGATAVFVDSTYRYAFETVWGKVKTISGTLSYDGGTGGGVSQLVSHVNWQDSITGFTAGGYGLISSNGNRRAVPDVAMLGDPTTGLLIIAEGQPVQDGGTSLACPLFSATLVLVNQARNLLNKGTPIGHAAPYLYQRNQQLLSSRSINLIIPPAVIISGATTPPFTTIQGTPTPASAFTINNDTFGWDSALTLEPEAQFWNDSVGVGSPNLPNFVITMANM